MNDLKLKLLAMLLSIPNITHKEYPNRDDGFSGLLFKGKEFAHFHQFHELDLWLGKALIKQEGLSHFPDSINHPKRAKSSPYIELRFNSEADPSEIVRLVELSLADR